MKSNGFTLIELIIVVAIIGILAATAVPLYNAYINEAARSEARTTLADIATKEEAYFSAWRKYQAAAGDYPNVKGATSAGTRTPQIVGSADAGNWEKLGISKGMATGGLWDGPVYFRYAAVRQTDPGLPQGYRVCAHRWTPGGGEEMLSLANTNRRAFVERTSSQCQVTY